MRLALLAMVLGLAPAADAIDIKKLDCQSKDSKTQVKIETPPIGLHGGQPPLKVAIETTQGLKPLGVAKTTLEFIGAKHDSSNEISQISATLGAQQFVSPQGQIDSILNGPPLPGEDRPAWVETCRNRKGDYLAELCKDRSQLYEVIDGKLHAQPKAFIANFPDRIMYADMDLSIVDVSGPLSVSLLGSWAQYIEELDASGKPVKDASGRTVYRLVRNDIQHDEFNCR